MGQKEREIDIGKMVVIKRKLILSSETGANSLTEESNTIIGSSTSSSKEKEDLTKEERVKIVNGELQVKIYDSQEEFEKNLPETVSILEGPFGGTVYLVGTAHFSEESMNDVSFVIRNVCPDFVMVELCSSRIHILRHDEETLLKEAQDLNAAKIRSIFQTNGLNGLFYILLLNISAKLTKQLGRAPGGEFRRAFSEVQRVPNCKLHLGDRPINITLQRALQGLSIWETVKLVWRLVTSDNTISAEEVEQCKKKDLLEQLMEEMAGEFPVFDDVFVKERDMFLTYSLWNAATCSHGVPPVRVVGVVGIGHAAGIKAHWGKIDSKKIEEILQIPPTSLGKKIVKNSIKFGLIALVCFGAYKIVKPRLPSLM